MQKTVDYTSLRIKRMKRRALVRKIYPYVLLLIALLVIYLILHCRSVVKPVSYIPRVEAAFASQIATPSATQTPIVKKDKRVEILERFFEDKNSPLATYSAFLIETADKYALDWTLMPAISGMESSFGKRMPEGSNNPFGLGGGNLMNFPTLYDSIEYEGKLLSKKYKLASNRAIGSIYCPSFECNQNWAVIVTNFSEEILN